MSEKNIDWQFIKNQTNDICKQISESQFKRCINQSFGVTVSENDFNQIKETFGSAKNIGMINYREFVNGLHENGKVIFF